MISAAECREMGIAAAFEHKPRNPPTFSASLRDAWLAGYDAEIDCQSRQLAFSIEPTKEHTHGIRSRNTVAGQRSFDFR